MYAVLAAILEEENNLGLYQDKTKLVKQLDRLSDNQQNKDSDSAANERIFIRSSNAG